jgi:SAM-dependent methyltransferase
VPAPAAGYPANVSSVLAGPGRGWQVTGVDISPVALDRARRTADDRGRDVNARIIWLQADAATWEQGAASYDLVTASYFHMPPAWRQATWDRLTAAVAPGGTLLLVAHHADDPHVAAHRESDADLFFTGADVVDRLDPRAWTIVTNTVARSSREGHGHDTFDVVVRAARHP